MTSEEMHLTSHRVSRLSENLTSVLTRICLHTPKPRSQPRLVLVSKLKPANDILALHTHPVHPQLHFGENYYQELREKAKILPKTIRWHFIGALQSNKCKPMAEEIGNLWAVESVDNTKKAAGLNKGRAALVERIGKEGEGLEKLNVFVQVNTSGEESKSGVEPQDAAELCRYIRDECPRLNLKGLMTIGAIARSQGAEEGKENEDFLTLKKVRDEVSREMGMQEGDLELSMGMSGDFTSAIRCGSDEVRIGSTVFGERPSKQDAKIKEDIEEEKA
ncbi:MAG: hypothetical protein Q9181_004118 [Wetmoreana brouardii]